MRTLAISLLLAASAAACSDAAQREAAARARAAEVEMQEQAAAAKARAKELANDAQVKLDRLGQDMKALDLELEQATKDLAAASDEASRQKVQQKIVDLQARKKAMVEAAH